MACTVCTHCDGIIVGDKVVRSGHSYHKQCERCYVCNEADLDNSETFKGVILCSGCAQRIFEGCVGIKNLRTSVESDKKSISRKLQKKRKGRRHHKRERDDRSAIGGGVIEMAARGGLTDTDSSIQDIAKSPLKQPPKLPQQHSSEHHSQNTAAVAKAIRKGSAEMGVTTDITEELLKAIHFQNHIQCNVVPAVKVSQRPKSKWFKKNDKRCSDLRIAELGQSTEIANISANGKNLKEKPLTIKSDINLPTEEPKEGTLSESDSLDYGSNVWSQGNLSTIVESRTIMDKHLRSIIKMPIHYFKRNILYRKTKSSLDSIAVGSEDKQTCLSKIKFIFKPEVNEHQKRGVRRLYSSINRRQIPFKLGWHNQVSVSNRQFGLRFDAGRSKSRCRRREGCKHVHTSHSYRCMRAQVMKIAGPTKSELAEMRRKIAMLGVPKSIKEILRNRRYTKTLVSKGCGNTSLDAKKAVSCC